MSGNLLSQPLAHLPGRLCGCLLAALAGALPAAFGVPQPRVQAVLMPQAVVRGGQILLGDLGVLHGDEALAARARAVIVGQAPLPGQERDLDPDYIRIRLRQSRLDPGQVELIAPPRIRVRTAAREITPAEQVSHAEAAVRRLFEGQPDGSVVVEAATPPSPICVPEGTVEIVADPQNAASAAGTIQMVRLQVRVDGKTAATTAIAVRVRRLARVWVTTRALMPGTRLEAGDAQVETRDVAGIQNPVPPGQPVAGLRARRLLPAGAVLTTASLEATPDVRQGDTVRLTVRSGAVRISVPARALEDGTLGNTIRLAGPGGRECRARLVAPDAAEMTLDS